MLTKDIPGYEGLYAATEDGDIVSLIVNSSRRKGVLKPYLNNSGYLRVNLYKDGKVKHEYVHRLVARVFVLNVNGGSVVNHIDADKNNNRPENLEWVEQRDNVLHARQNGLGAKDRPVKAIDVLSGEAFEFINIREAATALFGKWWALNYALKQRGASFGLGQYRIEVSE